MRAFPALVLVASLLLTACPRRADVTDSTAQNGSAAEGLDGDAGLPAPKVPLENVSADASTSEPSAEEERPGEPPDGACTSDAQCPRGMVCEGCGEDDRRCLPGCRTTADCSSGETCQKVQCIRCPCPPLCGS